MLGLFLILDHIQILQARARIKQDHRVVRTEESPGAQLAIRSQRGRSFRRGKDSFYSAPFPHCVHDLVVGDGQCDAAALLENIEN
jgi:hypothetical protein